MKKIALPESEEKLRKQRMTTRLSVLFVILDFALLGVLIFEILQLFN